MTDTTRVVSSRFPRLTNSTQRYVNAWNNLGEQFAFYIRTVLLFGEAIRRYKSEILRLVAYMSLALGRLALIGGSVVITAAVVMNVSFIVTIWVFTQLAGVGVEAVAGFLAAFAQVRVVVPMFFACALSATVGAAATAQLGAMRVNDEIDALEVMGVRSLAYLGSTRVLAGMIVAVPLGCVSLIGAVILSRFVVSVTYGQSMGGYDHYFAIFLKPTDTLWMLIQVFTIGMVIMLISVYNGYNASGGPTGVGEATGRAVRAAMTVGMFLVALFSLAAYGYSGDFNLSG
ncbi:ABC transporter permease [Mycolicibacterium sp. XJ1819]